ncbi:unnamed protein product [Malus baccata var. baccata]
MQMSLAWDPPIREKVKLNVDGARGFLETTSVIGLVVSRSTWAKLTRVFQDHVWRWILFL